MQLEKVEDPKSLHAVAVVFSTPIVSATLGYSIEDPGKIIKETCMHAQVAIAANKFTQLEVGNVKQVSQDTTRKQHRSSTA